MKQYFVWDDWDLWLKDYQKYMPVPPPTIDDFPVNIFMQKLKGGNYRKFVDALGCGHETMGMHLSAEECKGYSDMRLQQTHHAFLENVDVVVSELGFGFRLERLLQEMNKLTIRLRELYQYLSEAFVREKQVLRQYRKCLGEEMRYLCIPVYVRLRSNGYSHRDLC